MPVYLKACPRDNGDMYSDSDQYGSFIKCLQCGYGKDIRTDLTHKNGVSSRDDSTIHYDPYMQIALAMIKSDAPLTKTQISSEVIFSDSVAGNLVDLLLGLGYAGIDSSGRSDTFFPKSLLKKSFWEYDKFVESVLTGSVTSLLPYNFSLFSNKGELSSLGNLVKDNGQILPNLSTLVKLISEKSEKSEKSENNRKNQN
jgi:hypothetical protein